MGTEPREGTQTTIRPPGGEVLRHSASSRPTSAGEARALLRQTLVRLCLGLVAFATLSAWVQHAVDLRIQAQVGAQLTASVRSATVALDYWRQSVEARASDLAQAQSFVQLIEQKALSPSSLSDAAEHDLAERLDDLVRSTQADGFLVTGPSGTVIMATANVLVDQQLPLPAERFARWLSLPDQTVWTPALYSLNREVGPQPYLLFSTPIERAHRSVAAVHLLMAATARFSEIMSYGRPGDTAETYAFDVEGRLISASRFHPQLTQLGLLPEGARSAILNVEARDPGVSLVRGTKASQPRSQQPLTVPVQRALGGETEGRDVHGYRDYRGVPVVGAWYFSEKYHLGFITEVDIEEAFALRSWLRFVLGGIGAAFSVVIALAALSEHQRSKLELRSQRAEAKARRLGQYTLARKLGEGGMGAVYVARHALLRRPTAIKLIKSSGSDAISEERFARFEREAQHTAELTHPNTISVYDYGKTPEGTFYYAMEYLDGLDLDAFVEVAGPLSADRAVYLILQACGSLAEAHDRGMIHRDIKPSNLMVCQRGGEFDRIKVLDFGLVKSIGPLSQDAAVTADGAVAGTPLYMAPEIVRSAESASPRSDVYALGAVLYFLLSGRHIFPAQDGIAVMVAQMTQAPQRLSDLVQNVPPAVEAVIDRCLSKDPARRPVDARALAKELRAAIDCRWDDDAAASWWSGHPNLLPPAEPFGDEEPAGPGAEQISETRRHHLATSDTLAVDEAATPRPASPALGATTGTTK